MLEWYWKWRKNWILRKKAKENYPLHNVPCKHCGAKQTYPTGCDCLDGLIFYHYGCVECGRNTSHGKLVLSPEQRREREIEELKKRIADLEEKVG